KWLTAAKPRAVSGAVHEISRDEFLVAAVDRRGHLVTVNTDFVRLDRSQRSELVGTPPLQLWHPNTPAGVLAFLADELLAGRPVGAYLDWVAQDGSAYAAFTTVAPVGPDFIVTAIRPLRSDLCAQKMARYAPIRQVERAAAKWGLNAQGVAALGYDKLTETLAETGQVYQTGFGGLDLIAEMAARSAWPDGLATRPGINGRPASMLLSCHSLDAALRLWSERHQALTQLADSLIGVTPHLSATTVAARLAVAGLMGAGSSSAVMRDVAARLARVGDLLEDLSHQLQMFHHSCEISRVWIALAEIHVAACNRIVVDSLDHGPARLAPEALRYLSQALQDDLTAIDELAEQQASETAAIIHHLDLADSLTIDHDQLLDDLGQQTPGGRDHPQLEQLTTALGTVATALPTAVDLARTMASVIAPGGIRRLQTQVGRLQTSL
ncbi:MAG: PAS domain-containing protein, partial [Propionibacteriaceae bacterium]|nr:PAS domain-containing protein [Propionibacteriaceae bacterium]